MSSEFSVFFSGIFKDLLPEKMEDKSRLGKRNMDLGILKEGMWSLAKRTAPLKLRAKPWWDFREAEFPAIPTQEPLAL